MDRMKQLMFENYALVTGFEPFEDDWEPRIKRMLSTICRGRYTREQIVFTRDNSILDNGSSGMVFTTEALCVKDGANSTHSFIAPYKEIERCEFDKDSIFGVDISAIEIFMKSGEKYRLSTCLGALNLRQMQKILENAVELSKLKELPEPKGIVLGDITYDEDYREEDSPLMDAINGIFEASANAIETILKPIQKVADKIKGEDDGDDWENLDDDWMDTEDWEDSSDEEDDDNNNDEDDDEASESSADNTEESDSFMAKILRMMHSADFADSTEVKSFVAKLLSEHTDWKQLKTTP